MSASSPADGRRPDRSGGARATVAMLAGVAGGLLLSASTVADWFAVETQRDVGGVVLPDERSVTGGLLAGELLVVGLAAVVVALSLVVVRRRARQGAGVGLLVLAVVASGFVVRAFFADVEGAPAAGVAIAVAGTVAVAGAGLAALRPTGRPTLSARYDLDADDADEEWRLASAEDVDAETER